MQTSTVGLPSNIVAAMQIDTKPAKEIGAAMIAASVIPLILNWTDVVKTRMQAAPAAGCTALPYTGGFRTIAGRILTQDGAWALWSTGMLASLGREMTVIGIRIGAYPKVRDTVSAVTKGQSGGEASLVSKFGAGVIVGGLSGLLASPFDLVRIRVQAEAGVVGSNGILTTGLRAGLEKRIHGSPHAFKVVLEDGVAGMFRGSGVNVVRSIFMTLGTVPVYEHTKHTAKVHLGLPDDPKLHFGSGFVAGLVGTTVAMPADVVRTRIMQSGSEGGLGIVGAVGSIVREQGPQGFMRGWVPAYMRIGPLFLLMPALVEQVRKRVFGLGYMV